MRFFQPKLKNKSYYAMQGINLMAQTAFAVWISHNEQSKHSAPITQSPPSNQEQNQQPPTVNPR